HAHLLIGGQTADKESGQAHHRQRDDESIAPPEQIPDMAEHQRPERPHDKARGKDQQRHDEGGGLVQPGQELRRDDRGQQAVEIEIIPFENRAQRTGEIISRGKLDTIETALLAIDKLALAMAIFDAQIDRPHRRVEQVDRPRPCLPVIGGDGGGAQRGVIIDPLQRTDQVDPQAGRDRHPRGGKGSKHPDIGKAVIARDIDRIGREIQPDIAPDILPIGGRETQVAGPLLIEEDLASNRSAIPRPGQTCARNLGAHLSAQRGKADLAPLRHIIQPRGEIGQMIRAVFHQRRRTGIGRRALRVLDRDMQRGRAAERGGITHQRLADENRALGRADEIGRFGQDSGVLEGRPVLSEGPFVELHKGPAQRQRIAVGGALAAP
ncbi:hypothetical protein E4T56_gene3906, partial [Termitomyces sp. T112]